MKRSRMFLLIPAAALLFTCSKTNTANQPLVCQQPTMAVAQGTCENSYADGVLLKVSGYDAGGQSRQFTYYVFPQKDTTSSNLATTNVSYGNASNDQILIPLAKLNSAPKFVVTVSMYCDGTAAHTGLSTFAFVKRPTANPACYVWALQKM